MSYWLYAVKSDRENEISLLILSKCPCHATVYLLGVRRLGFQYMRVNLCGMQVSLAEWRYVVLGPSNKDIKLELFL